MTKNLHIGYLSMEIAIRDDIKTYCGGLGILAGDTIKTATEMGIKMSAVSLLHKDGWLKQIIDNNGRQKEEKDSWNYLSVLELTDEKVELNIWNRRITMTVWKYTLKTNNNYCNNIYFLDTDNEFNNNWDKQLTNQIYPINNDIFLTQETLLGVGGIILLQTIDPNIQVFHLNESHCMSSILHLYNQLEDWQKVKEKICFTNHTPLESGHQKEKLDKLKYFLPENYINLIPKEIINNDILNFTTMCIFGSKFNNAVSKKHQEITQKMYPQYQVNSITNGVSLSSWVSKYHQKIYNNYLGDWKNHPQLFSLAKNIPDLDFSLAHQKAKNRLINIVNLYSNIPFEKDIFTIGFARRVAPYKRPDLILQQFDRLKDIAKKHNGLQLIFSGKALPGLEDSYKIVEFIIKKSKESDNILKIAFLPDYGMKISEIMTSGVDLWLNNPLPPLEASGTSGMKASINGIPNFSISDGWWLEGGKENINGWNIGRELCQGNNCRIEEIEDLYIKLDQTILTTYYQYPSKWLEICKNSVATVGPIFNTQRMLIEYINLGYFNNFGVEK